MRPGFVGDLDSQPCVGLVFRREAGIHPAAINAKNVDQESIPDTVDFLSIVRADHPFLVGAVTNGVSVLCQNLNHRRPDLILR